MSINIKGLRLLTEVDEDLPGLKDHHV